MKARIFLFTLMLSLCSTTATALQFPSGSEVVKAVVSCRALDASNKTMGMQKVTTLDHESSIELLSFLQSIDDHWISWGFNTSPAGDIGITFWLSKNQSFLVQTWYGLEKIGTDAGHRDLSQQERNDFQLRLPSCAHSNPALKRDAPSARPLAPR